MTTSLGISRMAAIITYWSLVPGLLLSQTTKLDRDMQRLLAENNVPSVSIAKVASGRITFEHSYGKQDANHAVTAHTLYNIASLTKPITAQVAMLLLSAGVFTLDEAMAPTWTDPDIADDERRKLLTPRMALTHQTGFPNWRSMTKDKLGIRFTPGTDYSYSGEGFQYLMHYMEKKTGMSLAQSAKKLVFDPLGMRETSFTRETWFDGRVAVPADKTGAWLTPHFADHPISADLVYTTAHDYALLLLAAIENKGLNPSIAAERDKVQVSLKEKMCPSLPPGASCPDQIGSGLSWQILRFGQITILMHTGHDPGVSTLAYFSPDQKSGVVILTNGENGSKLFPAILQHLQAPEAFVKLLDATTAK